MFEDAKKWTQRVKIVEKQNGRLQGGLTGIGEKSGGMQGAGEEWEVDNQDGWGVRLTDGGDQLGQRLKQESRFFTELGEEGNKSEYGNLSSLNKTSLQMQILPVEDRHL